MDDVKNVGDFSWETGSVFSWKLSLKTKQKVGKSGGNKTNFLLLCVAPNICKVICQLRSSNRFLGNTTDGKTLTKHLFSSLNNFHGYVLI